MAAKKSSGSGKASTPKQDATQAKNRAAAAKSEFRRQAAWEADKRLGRLSYSKEGVKGNRMQSKGIQIEQLSPGSSQGWPFKTSDALQGGRKRTTTRATTTKKAADARRKGAR